MSHFTHGGNRERKKNLAKLKLTRRRGTDWVSALRREKKRQVRKKGGGRLSKRMCTIFSRGINVKNLVESDLLRTGIGLVIPCYRIGSK